MFHMFAFRSPYIDTPLQHTLPLTPFFSSTLMFCTLFSKPTQSFMPQKLKSKQKIWISISIFFIYVAGSVFPNAFI